MRIPVHRFAAQSLLTCRASIALWPIIGGYFAPTCRHRRLLSDSPVAAAAAEDRRRWVMLSTTSRHRRPDDTTYIADLDTMAESRTSNGRRVHVSLRCAAPPSSTYLYYDFPENTRGEQGGADRISVIAAHGEFVLLEMQHYGSSSFVDHFVYRPAGPRRPPSLSLLPVLDFLAKPEIVFRSNINPPPIRLSFDSGSIGLLRLGDNNLLAVQAQWELMEPVPVLDDDVEGGKGDWQKMLGSPDDAICIGDRFICWINYRYDFLLCNMADEASPKVRYVPLPLEVRHCSYGNDSPMRIGRMGAAGDNSVRFVSIHPHSCVRDDLCSRDDADCWCVVSDRTTLGNPCFVYTIKTWTMNLSMNETLEWIEDGEMESEEILALPGYQGLPQAIPEWPVVCLDKPNVICFVVSNYYFTKDNEKLWMVQLNINTKTLLSVVEFTDKYDCWYWKKYNYLLAVIQY